MTIEEAKDFLHSKGYYADCLWTTWDVQHLYECTEEEAQSILDGALNNEWITEQIFATIKDLAEDKGLTKI